MGLRAPYFLLADMAGRFHSLKYGLASRAGVCGCENADGGLVAYIRPRYR